MQLDLTRPVDADIGVDKSEMGGRQGNDEGHLVDATPPNTDPGVSPSLSGLDCQVSSEKWRRTHAMCLANR